MLVQLDGSYHRWLGDNSPPFTLLLAVDDATGSLVDALFCEQEDSRNYFLLMQSLLRHRGIPLAPMPTATLSSSTSRNISPLGIQMIFARSPQAKARLYAF